MTGRREAESAFEALKERMRKRAPSLPPLLEGCSDPDSQPRGIRGDLVIGGLWVGAIVRTPSGQAGCVVWLVGDEVAVGFGVGESCERTTSQRLRTNRVHLLFDDAMGLNLDGLARQIGGRLPGWGETPADLASRLWVSPFWPALLGPMHSAVRQLALTSIYLYLVDQIGVSLHIGVGGEVPRFRHAGDGVWALLFDLERILWSPSVVPALEPLQRPDQWLPALILCFAHQESTCSTSSVLA